MIEALLMINSEMPSKIERMKNRQILIIAFLKIMGATNRARLGGRGKSGTN
jgi:hypothetical protein